MDISTKYNDYQNLGQEFLEYLYLKANLNDLNYELGKRIVFAKFDDNKIIEKTVISGDYSDSKTGKLLLVENAKIIEMQILISEDNIAEATKDDKYHITLKASDLSLNGFKTPKIETTQTDDYMGSILLKMEQVEIAFKLVDELYKQFLDIRLNADLYDHYQERMVDMLDYPE